MISALPARRYVGAILPSAAIGGSYVRSSQTPEIDLPAKMDHASPDPTVMEEPGEAEAV